MALGSPELPPDGTHGSLFLAIFCPSSYKRKYERLLDFCPDISHGAEMSWSFQLAEKLTLFSRSGAVIASRGTAKVSTGNNVMMLGLASQVVTLAIFGIMAGDVFLRIRKFRGEFNESTTALRHSKRFKGLLIAILTSYITIFLRCVYRIAEMAGGWRNRIMQDQVSFIILDGVMCIVAVYALNIFHPGFLFKQSYETLKVESEVASETQMGTVTPNKV